MWSLRLRIVLAGSLIALAAFGAARASGASAPVVLVPISGSVDRGTEQLVLRALALAGSTHARALVLDINSSGGLDSVLAPIRTAIRNAPVPTLAYVSGHAYNSASLIALAARRVLLAPDATISTPAAASSSGILVLDSAEAVQAHIASGIAPTLEDALSTERLGGAPIVEVPITLAERIASFVSEPLVAGLLIGLGLLGLLVEMQTLHGLAGFIGIAALALYFGSQLFSGFADWFVALVAALGVIGILWELHILPGHTLPGALGALLLLGALLFSFGTPYLVAGVEALATAIVLATIGFTMALRAFPENAWSSRLALAAVQGPDFVTAPNRFELMGKSGMALTYLRPAGHGLFDGERIDVLTEGEFIAAGTPIRVTRVEGARIFVEPIPFPRERITS
ncbi:MAG: NfeD family protein [Candidatus Baltobacteraceae bacterium]